MRRRFARPQEPAEKSSATWGWALSELVQEGPEVSGERCKAEGFARTLRGIGRSDVGGELLVEFTRGVCIIGLMLYRGFQTFGFMGVQIQLVIL